MTNTELSVPNHETGRPLSRVPAASRSSAVKYTLSPTARLALEGCTVTVATGAPGEPTTSMVIASLTAPLAAVIVTDPGSRPKTAAVSVPPEETSAIAGSLLVHVTDGLETGSPLASPTDAWSRIAPPTPTDVGPVMLRYAPPEPAFGRVTDSVSGGRYPTDPVSGGVAGRYLSAGLRLRTALPRPRVLRDPQPLSRSPANGDGGAGFTARLDIQPAGDGTVRVVLYAPAAATVDVAGDFTDWRAVALRRAGEGTWECVLPMSSGVHRINVRVDGGRWTAPEGTTRVADEFGGEVGIVAVP